MKRWWQGFLHAVMFLTRIPIEPWVRYDSRVFANSAVYFPLVGAVVGALGGTVLLVTAQVWSTPIAVAASMAATVLLTGTFHEDGLADTADGLVGGTTPERRLEIMRDSRIGSYGTIAILLVFAMKFACLADLLEHGTVKAALAMIGAHTIARAASLSLILWLPYVGASGGKSKPVIEKLDGGKFIVSSTIASAIALVVLPFPDSLVAIIVATAVVTGIGFYFRHKIGGITGDCGGAAMQISEVAVYLSLTFHCAR
jgi:adenosylcobinamide-GDP ribazoletransferase